MEDKVRRHPITLDAKTTAGGKVISACSALDICGKAIALEGDKVACPACRSVGVIVCAGKRLPESWCGRQLALENDECRCGCSPPPKLIPSQRMRYQDVDGGHDDGSGHIGAQVAGVKPVAKPPQRFDEQLLLRLAQGSPLARVRYRLSLADGATVEGETDDEGRTSRVETPAPQEIVAIERSRRLAQTRAAARRRVVHPRQCASSPRISPPITAISAGRFKMSTWNRTSER